MLRRDDFLCRRCMYRVLGEKGRCLVLYRVLGEKGRCLVSQVYVQGLGREGTISCVAGVLYRVLGEDILCYKQNTHLLLCVGPV